MDNGEVLQVKEKATLVKLEQGNFFVDLDNLHTLADCIKVARSTRIDQYNNKWTRCGWEDLGYFMIR